MSRDLSGEKQQQGGKPEFWVAQGTHQQRSFKEDASKHTGMFWMQTEGCSDAQEPKGVLNQHKGLAKCSLISLAQSEWPHPGPWSFPS